MNGGVKLAAKVHVWNPWKSACAEPGRLAVATDDGERVGYAELVRDADRIGRALIVMGITDGSRISTDLRAGPQFYAVALAALKFGFTLFPVNASYVRRGVSDALCQKAGTVLHIAEGSGSIEGPAVAYGELADCRRGVSRRASQAGRLIFATSGTTSGEPGVITQPRPGYPYQGVAVLERYAAGRSFGPHIMGNPTFHLGTLGPALHALQAGSGVVVAHDWSPGNLDRLVRDFSASSAFLSVDRLTEYALSGASPTGLSKLFHGGDSAPAWVKRKAIEVHGPILHEYYGTSDGVVSEISSQEWLRHLGSVGRPLPGIRLAVRKDGAALPAGGVGEITVHPRRSADGDAGIVATGDLGYVDSDGYLYVLGRVSEAGGTAEALAEHSARAVAGVRDVVVIEGTELTCLVEAEDGEREDVARGISAAVGEACVRPCAVFVFPPGALERTASGKISRPAAKRLAAFRRGHPHDAAA